MLPVFILQLPEEGRAYTDLPYAEPLRLDEGSHFSYAIQWFMFAAILGIGYLFLIQQQEKRLARLAAQPPEDGDQPDVQEAGAAVADLSRHSGHA